MLAGGCFAAGTKLWTPEGYRNVEHIREGELVFSRDQFRPDGLIEAKPVEKISSASRRCCTFTSAGK